MNSKIDAAIARLTEECKDKDHLIPFEEYLTSICTNEDIADKILNPKKQLEKCFDTMKNIAKKRAVNGCAYIPPEEGYEIIRDYYDIGNKEPETEQLDEVIDVFDFL